MSEQNNEVPAQAATGYVVLLAVLIGFSMMDRQILAIVAEPVKHEFNLTDTELGYLTGPLFAVVFAALSVPVAWAADHMSRTALVTVCATAWAMCTIGMGTATNFLHLAVTRMGLAVGEAGCNPCAQSLIADYVSREQRNRAMGIYVMGSPAGLIAAGILGGQLTDAFGWRVAFYALGAASLLLALIAAVYLPEPKRQKHAKVEDNPAGYRELWRKPAFRYLIAAGSLASISIYAGLAWGVIFVVRYFGWTPGQAGTVFGTLGAVVALGGAWAGGPMADWFAKRNAKWQLWFPGLMLFLATPCSVAFIFAPSLPILFAASSGEAMFRSMSLAPGAAALQRLATHGTRARAAATAGVTGTLIGLGLGPFLVGAISDALATHVGADSLRYGLLAMVVPQVIAAWCNFQAARTIDTDFED